MHPIYQRHQAEAIKKDNELPLAAALFGISDANHHVSLPRLLSSVEQGVWDEEIRAPSCGPAGRSLLLTFLGSCWCSMVAYDGTFTRNPDVEAVARAMVIRGADPLAKDEDGRDSLDQAFAVAEGGLLSEWLGLLPDINAAQDRICEGGNHGRLKLPWLHQAVLGGDTSMVQSLLSAGMNPNHATPDGETPLFWASSPEVVEQLSKAGCDPMHRNHAGQNAKVFWAVSRSLPQSTISPMVAALPSTHSTSLSREQRIADFYSLALTAGKGALVPELARLKVQPGEVDKEGFSLIGNLGSRLLDKSSSNSAQNANKSRHWAMHLLGDASIRALASRKDWRRLWLGACRFGLGEEDGVKGKLIDPSFSKDLGFYRECVEEMMDHALQVSEDSIEARQVQGLAHNASLLLRGAAEQCEGEGREDLAAMALRCLVQAGKWQGTYNAIPFSRAQKDFLDWMVAHPNMKLERSPDLWHLALCVDNARQTINQNSPRLSLDLLRHLEQSNTPVPSEISQLMADAIPLLSGTEQLLVADMQAKIMQQKTREVEHRSTRMRL